MATPDDSLQEFKIQTSVYDAQYGKTSGGIINVKLKSGTNSLQGSVYEMASLAQTDHKLWSPL